MTPLEADRAARRLAQREFVRPLVLEAGAGTGKTSTLVARILAWSLGPGWERAADRGTDERRAAAVLGGIVAITFTEAAAAEMAERAARGFAALAHQPDALPENLDPEVLPPPEVRSRRARALLATLDHLSVRTIHAWCRSLLAAWPVEAEIHPNLTVDADGRRVPALVEETVETALRTGYGSPGDPDLLYLAAQGYGPPQLVEALLVLIDAGLPAAALAADPFASEIVAALEGRLRTAATALHRLLAPCLGRKMRKDSLLPQVAEALSRLIEQPGSAREFPDKLTRRIKDWAKDRRTQEENDLLGGCGGELRAAAEALHPLLAAASQLDPELLTAARRALQPLLARLEQERQSRGIETFQGLLAGAARLLARHPEVRSQVRRGIDQLLVDEFQDTDLLQCEILRRLAFDGAGEERPGLFLVGDPKQSIYGWRSADLRAYDGFVAEVRAAGGVVGALSENFRSLPAILNEVSRVIAPVMAEKTGLQPPFVPLLPSAARAAQEALGPSSFVRSSPRRRASVEHWISWSSESEEKTSSADANEVEAAALAADLLELRASCALPWKQVGILLRSTSDLDVYLEALRRAGIPFQVGRDRQYYRRREIIEAAALVRTLLDPGDHLALLTVLRSAAVGVPDAALIPLWRHDFPKLVTDRHTPPELLRQAIAAAAAELPGDIPGLAALAGWEASLAAAVEHLAFLRRSFDSDPADVFVAHLRQRFPLEAIEAARYLGAYRLANLDRFFRQLLVALEEGDGAAVLRFLRQSVVAGRDAEEGRPQDAAEDAVAVLTIHGAKGLDFEHVYLLQLHKLSRDDRPFHQAAQGAGGAWEYQLFGAPTPGWAALEAERDAIAAAERVRTLYVAMTRAKERLVLAGNWPRRELSPPAPERARSHIDLLRSRRGLPDGGIAALRESAAGEPWVLDSDGVLWRFPEPSPAEAPEGRSLPENLELPPLATVRRQAVRLRELRQAALERQDRRWSAPASEASHALLRDELAARRFAGAGERSGAVVSRDAAMAAGTAVHRALEDWDLHADPAGELARQLRRLPATVAVVVEEREARAAAQARAAALLERFAAGPLLTRLRGLAPHLVARELPVLLPPLEEAGAVGVLVGAVDLVYRDAGSGELVVVDFKTDDLAGEDLAGRAAVYGPQAALYSRALQEALDLPAPPRCEFWFLAAGEVVEGPGTAR